jgi:hypothetical protein
VHAVVHIVDILAIIGSPIPRAGQARGLGARSRLAAGANDAMALGSRIAIFELRRRVMRLLLAAVSLATLLGASSAMADALFSWSAATKPEFHNYLSAAGPARCYWYDRCYCHNCTRPLPSVFEVPAFLVLSAPK